MMPRIASGLSPISCTKPRRFNISLPFSVLLGKFSEGQTMIDLDDYFIIFFIGHLKKCDNKILSYNMFW